MTISKALDKHGVAHEYEARSLNYVEPKTHKQHTYTPDFTFPCSNIIVEVKGYFNLEDRRKHLILKEQYPELDFRFIFQRSCNKLRKQSKGTYASWCKRYGFRFADGRVPDEWIGEIDKTQEAAYRETQGELRSV